MSDQVSNEALMGVLLDIKGDLGEIKGTVAGHASALAAQIVDSRALSEDVQKLQLSNARQRGFVAAISTVGAIIGAALGAVADYFSRGHG